MPEGLDDAAATLGISTEMLVQALQLSGEGRLDLAVAAKMLGLNEDSLRTVLPPPPSH